MSIDTNRRGPRQRAVAKTSCSLRSEPRSSRCGHFIWSIMCGLEVDMHGWVVSLEKGRARSGCGASYPFLGKEPVASVHLLRVRRRHCCGGSIRGARRDPAPRRHPEGGARHHGGWCRCAVAWASCGNMCPFASAVGVARAPQGLSSRLLFLGGRPGSPWEAVPNPCKGIAR